MVDNSSPGDWYYEPPEPSHDYDAGYERGWNDGQRAVEDEVYTIWGDEPSDLASALALLDEIARVLARAGNGEVGR